MTRPRILLADDHVLVAQALEHLLQAEFDVVGTVSDGRALVEAAGKLAPDVVVVDIGMPLLNGLDAGAQLKTLHPEMKVIYLTQNREPRFAIEAFRRQASGYLLKDSAASELTTAIRDALGGRTYVSPLIARGMVDEASSPPVDQIALRQLSGREREVLQLLAEGKSMKEVAGAAEVEGGEALRGQVARCHDHVEKHDVVGIGDVEDRNRAARRPLQADECIGATGDIEERYAFPALRLGPGFVRRRKRPASPSRRPGSCRCRRRDCLAPGGLLSKDLVHERDRNRPFTDRRCDSFDVAAAHVANGKDPGPARFEQVRPSCQRPVRLVELLR